MHNSKKLTSIVVCSFLLSSSLVNTEFFGKDVKSMLEKIAKGTVLVGGGTIGIRLTKMNKKYSKEGKKPDGWMRLNKTGGAALLLLAIEYMSSDNSLASWNGATKMTCKILVFGGSTAMLAEPVAKFLRTAPLIKHMSGFLTDPVDSDGYEIKDFSAAIRVLVTYLTVRPAATMIADYFFPDGNPSETNNAKATDDDN